MTNVDINQYYLSLGGKHDTKHAALKEDGMLKFNILSLFSNMIKQVNLPLKFPL